MSVRNNLDKGLNVLLALWSHEVLMGDPIPPSNELPKIGVLEKIKLLKYLRLWRDTDDTDPYLKLPAGSKWRGDLKVNMDINTGSVCIVLGVSLWRLFTRLYSVEIPQTIK